MRLRTSTAAFVVGALSLGACGGGDDAPEIAATTAAPDTEASEAAPGKEPLSCLMLGEQTADPSFQATLSFDPDPPKVEGTTIIVDVTRDGEPVEDAEVCVIADMPSMTHGGVLARTEQTEPGRYTTETTWGMRGDWDGHARVTVGDEVVLLPIETSVS